MKPCVVGSRLYVVFEIAEGCSFASPHLAHLVIEETCDEDAEFEYVENEVVHFES